MASSSGRPTAVITGSFNRVELEIPCTEFRSPTQIMGQLLASVAQFSERQTVDRIGLARPAGQPASFGAFRLPIQTTEQPSVAMEPSCEQQMEETHGLTRPAEPPIR